MEGKVSKVKFDVFRGWQWPLWRYIAQVEASLRCTLFVCLKVKAIILW